MELITNMANTVIDQDTGDMLEYCQLQSHPKISEAWNTSSANEYGCSAQGIIGRIKTPSNTIFSINKSEVPEERFKDCTYGKLVCVVVPHKSKPNQMRLTVGGN